MLLRLQVNCNVPFFSDVQSPGCEINNDGVYSCGTIAGGTSNGHCSSRLLLTITPGAYYDTPVVPNATVPDEAPALAITGFTCHPEANQQYILKDNLLRGKPHWATMDVNCAIVWTSAQVWKNRDSGEGRWVLLDLDSTHTDNHGYSAFLDIPTAYQDTPWSSSTAVWREYCSGGYRPNDRALVHQIDAPGRRRVQTAGDELHNTAETHAPTHGTVQRIDRIVIARADVESQAQIAWEAMPANGRTLSAPPSLDEMLVSGTEANKLLGSLFTTAQQPHVVYPLSMQLDHDDSDDAGNRRLQHEGDRLAVVVDTHAPSLFDAGQAEQRLIDSIPGVARSKLRGVGSCDLAARTETLNAECCSQDDQDCSAGLPSSCSVDCATVVLPFFDDCSTVLGNTASRFDGLVALCQAALDRSGRRLQVQDRSDPGPSAQRRLQMGGDTVHRTEDIHVCGLGSADSQPVGCTVKGQTNRQLRLVVSRTDVEARAAAVWQSEQDAVHTRRRMQMSDDHLTHPTEIHAPTLDEMLVSGTPANALLSRLFIQEQEPHAAIPTSFVLDAGGTGKDGGRRMQAGDDQLLTVTIETHAATPAEADRAVHRLALPTGILLPREQTPVPSTCDAALAPCANARKASLGECLLCANKHASSSSCAPTVIDAFCAKN
jgi:hypothetical protein